MRIRGLGGVPSSGVSAVALSVTAVNTQGSGYVTVYNSGLALPATSNINYTAGENTSLAATVELSAGGEIQVFVGGYTSTDLTVDVYGYFTASADGAQQFVALDPSKVLDTRSGLGTCTPSPCARRPDNSSFSTQVAGRGGIPVSGVGAVVVNLTSVNPGPESGWLRVNPTGSAPSTLDVVVTPPGETTANQVTTRLGADGRIEVRNGVHTDVVIDVIGYYTSTAPAPVTATTTYTYDADGLRTSKSSGGVTTRFVWDRSGPLPLLLEERVGPSVNRYVYGPAGSPVADTLANGTVRYYHRDQIGSTRALTGSTGAPVATFSHDAYGAEVSQTGTATTPFGYVGEYRDNESRLVYLRARYYDPETGQFINRDPLEAMTRDPYVYGGGNPANFTDPTGLISFGDAWDATGGRTVSAVADVAETAREAAQDTGEFIVRNRDTIASVGAAAVCLGTLGTGCVVATALAVGIRSEVRFREHGVNRDTVNIAVFDATLSFATLGLLRAPGQLATARLADPLAVNAVPVANQWWSRLLVESGPSGLMSLLGFYTRSQLDGELDC